MNYWLWFIVIFIFLYFLLFSLGRWGIIASNRLPGKTLIRDNMLCVEWDVKFFALTYSEFLRYPPDAIINRV